MYSTKMDVHNNILEEECAIQVTMVQISHRDGWDFFVEKFAQD